MAAEAKMNNQSNIVDLIARIITDDPCVFNEAESLASAIASPSNADVNQAAREATGSNAQASTQVADQMKDERDRAKREQAQRQKILNPLFKQADTAVKTSQAELEKVAGNTDDNKDSIDKSRDNVDTISDLIRTISQTMK